jgi:membrane protein required for colicin V production
LITSLVKAAGMGVLDSILGSLFGVLRGILIILVLVWLAGLSSFPERDIWTQAKTSSVAENVALYTKVWLPDNISQRIHYRNRN